MKKIYKSLKTFIVLLSLVAIKSNAQSYCTAQATSINDEEIFNVTFATLNNSSNCSSLAGGPGSIQNLYSNYTSVVSAPVVIQGFTYPLGMTVGQCNTGTYSGYVRVWIDYNQNGLFTDPGEQVYQSPLTTFNIPGTVINAGNITIPATASAGITRMRVIAVENALPNPCGNFTWGEVEDYNIQIITPTPCSAAPAPNSLATVTAAICPNTGANVSVVTNYTTTGITYQWLSSTVSSVGPFAPVTVPSGTLSTLATGPLTVTTWFQPVITCTNVALTTTPSAVQVQVSGVTTNSVPYFESFEGIGVNNKLPNCSWAASNIPTNCQTYISSNTLGRVPRTGTSFASFYYSPAATSYFYTNGIFLDAGITYSASLWYQTEYFGYNNWSDLSILYGPNQTTLGLMPIASTNGPAISNIYKSLSNTFTVATSGLYYIAVKAVGSTASFAQWLTWDDLSITIPCGPTSPNSPSLTLNTSTTTICAGDAVNITVNGADTYTWSTGDNTSGITPSPFSNSTYMVMGTNSLTGCTATLSQAIVVNPAPSLFVVTNKQTVCSGSPANLTAFGALSYTWSNGFTTQNVNVSPTAPTNYTVLGTNAQGCTGSAVQSIGVNPLPNVGAITSAPNDICAKESVTLTASGAVTYAWVSSTSSNLYQGTSFAIVPNGTTIFTVTGTDANGCQKSATVVQNVNECVGLKEIINANGVKIYPNPTAGEFTIESNNTLAKTIQVVDLTGRVISSSTNTNQTLKVNISNLANGIYYVKIQSNNSVEVVRVVKQ